MTTLIYKHKASLPLTFVLLVFGASIAVAQTSEFTYQGRLASGGQPAKGNYDFEFKLHDALSGGALLGTRAWAFP